MLQFLENLAKCKVAKSFPGYPEYPVQRVTSFVTTVSSDFPASRLIFRTIKLILFPASYYNPCVYISVLFTSFYGKPHESIHFKFLRTGHPRITSLDSSLNLWTRGRRVTVDEA